MAEQYKIFATEALPELADNQRAAFHCAYNGYIAPPNLEQEIDMLPWNIEQGYQYDSQIRDLLGSEEVAVTFISEIKEWSKAQKLAVIYMARAYWRQGPIVE